MKPKKVPRNAPEKFAITLKKIPFLNGTKPCKNSIKIPYEPDIKIVRKIIKTTLSTRLIKINF